MPVTQGVSQNLSLGGKELQIILRASHKLLEKVQDNQADPNHSEFLYQV